MNEYVFFLNHVIPSPIVRKHFIWLMNVNLKGAGKMDVGR